MTEIVLDNVSKSYEVKDDGAKTVIRDLSLSFTNGSLTALVGPNGCGKSTLLNLIAGTVEPDSGTVRITTSDGTPPEIGYVWQDYRATLLPWYSTWENITFPLRVRGTKAKERRQVAEQLLAGFATDIRPDQPIYKLSGGQQQLVSLLRSSVTSPDVLLLDEPLSALDQFTCWSMAFKIEQFWMKHKITAVFVSHDVDEAVMIADRIVLMSREGGRVSRTVENPLPRPRNVKMLTSTEHVRCRDAVIEFLTTEGAIKDQSAATQAS